MKNLKLSFLLLFSSCSISSLLAQQVRVTGNAPSCDGIVSASVTWTNPPGYSIGSHYWYIKEADAAGNVIPNGYIFYQQILGAPLTSYAFPSSLPGNKHYQISCDIQWRLNLSFISNRGSDVIYYRKNNPDFTLNFWAAAPNGGLYFYASPVVKDPFHDAGNFGYAWYLEELDNNNQPRYLINNPSNWWTMAPNPTPPLAPIMDRTNNFFADFNPILNTYTGTVNSLPPTNFAGVFEIGKRYRITRGTWVNGFCNWQQVSKTLYYAPAPLGKTSGASEDGNFIIEDTEAPNFENLAKDHYTKTFQLISAFPNPNQGSFTINFNAITSKSAQLKIYDISGKLLQESSISVVEGKNDADIELTQKNYKGIIFVQLEGYNNVLRLSIE
jgi:hypothetical protein